MPAQDHSRLPFELAEVRVDDGYGVMDGTVPP